MDNNMEYKKNDIITVTIDDMGHEGEGIGKTDGFTLFIKDAIIGDVVSAKIMKSKKNYAYARLEKVITPSPFRVEPICKYYRQCGGCQLQALSYEKQLEFKNNKIKNNLVRLGGFEEGFIEQIMEPMVGMEEPFRYRNKAQYPIGEDKEGNPITGFYAGRTHSIIPNTNCYLGVEENQHILELILAHMKEYGIKAYQEESGKGLVRHVLIRKGFTSREIMVSIVINENRKKQGDYITGQDRLLERLQKIPGMTSISLSLNSQRTNVIMGKEMVHLWGNITISDRIHICKEKETGIFQKTGQFLDFNISPLSFYQVNPIQTEKLYSLALEYADLTCEETVWDLYCGIGTISLFLATRAKKVYGVEIVPQAIEDAKQNAKQNKILNAEFMVGKAEEVLPNAYEEQGIYADVIVVDPPRKGCDEACLETMLKMKPKRIVYVSCDSATLARDLKVLSQGGYELKRVRGCDQFGQGVHVETVALLERKVQ